MTPDAVGGIAKPGVVRIQLDEVDVHGQRLDGFAFGESVSKKGCVPFTPASVAKFDVVSRTYS